jgi:hypothetical protein
MTLSVIYMQVMSLTNSKSETSKQKGYFSLSVHHESAGRFCTPMMPKGCELPVDHHLNHRQATCWGEKTGTKHSFIAFIHNFWPKQVTWPHWPLSGQGHALFLCPWKEWESTYLWSALTPLPTGLYTSASKRMLVAQVRQMTSGNAAEFMYCERLGKIVNWAIQWEASGASTHT